MIEAVDLSTPEKIYKAFEKGMIPGVKKKVFFNREAQQKYTQKHFENSLGNFADRVKEAGFTGPNFNKAFFLTLKKLGTYQNLRAAPKKISDTDWFDTLHTYFNNRNKQEVKNDPEVAKKFQEFENRKLDDNGYAEDKGFEQWANEKFAGKAKVKDESKEIEKIYDKGGWEIVVPKTFAAASKLACMADRKAHWCTAASPAMFKSYAKGDNKLYVIRNDAKDIMYQMDWGIEPDGSYYPNFKNEFDRSAKTGEVVKKIPAEVLDALKNPKTGKSIKDIYDEAKKKEEEKPEKDKPKPIKGEEGWTVRRLTPDEAKESLKGVKFTFGSKATDELSLEQLMSGRTGDYQDIKYVEEITNGKKYYYYVDGVVKRGQYGGRRYVNNIFEKKGDKLIAKTAQGLARLKNFPESVKKKLFQPSDLPIGEKGKKGEEIKPYKEVGGAKFYNFKSINQVFDHAGKPGLGEKIKRELADTRDGSEPLAYFQKGDVHYMFSIEEGKPFIQRYDLNTNYTRRRTGSDFQDTNFMRWAFYNKDTAKYLLELAYRSPKLKDKEIWKKAEEILDKGKIEAEENGKKFVLQRNEGSYGRPLEIVSPDFDNNWYFTPLPSGDGIEVRNLSRENPQRISFTSPQIKELERIYRRLTYGG